MWTIFKVFIEFVTTLFLYFVWFFGREACGILGPRPGIKPAHPILEGEILTTGPPGKSPDCCFYLWNKSSSGYFGTKDGVAFIGWWV